MSSVLMYRMKDRLPFDVWAAIAAHLPVKAILCLRCTCQDLYDMMGERVVWSLALSDILEIVRLPRLWHTMHMMSALELRQKAILVTRVDLLFDREVIEPANVRSYHTDIDVTQAAIAPGGDGIMLMYDDGTLHVHQTRNFTQSKPLVVLRPNCVMTAGLIHEPSPTLLLSSSGGHHVVVACDHYQNRDGRQSVFRIFRVDFGAPSIHPLSTITRKEAYRSFVFQEGYLVTRWRENGTYLISVRKIACSADEIEEEVVIDVGPDMVHNHPRLKRICAHMFVLSSRTHLYLYAIPPMVPVLNGQAPCIVRATALAVYGQEERGAIWNCICNHHEGGRVATAAETGVQDYALMIWPPKGQLEDTFIQHTGGAFDLGLCRALWAKEFLNLETIQLHVCTYLTKPDHYIGYMRLGRSRAPDPSHTVAIPLLGQAGSLIDISWDEESGTVVIVVLVSSHIEAQDRKVILAVDLV